MSRYTIVQTSFGLIYLLNVQILFLNINVALLNGIAIYLKQEITHICINMAVF